MLISPTFHNRSNTRHTQFGSVLFTQNAMSGRAFPTSTESAAFPIPLTAMAREALGRQLVEAKATQPGPSSLATCSSHSFCCSGGPASRHWPSRPQGLPCCKSSHGVWADWSPAKPLWTRPPSPFQAILVPPPYMKRSLSSQGTMRGPKVSASAKSLTFSPRNVCLLFWKSTQRNNSQLKNLDTQRSTHCITVQNSK